MPQIEVSGPQVIANTKAFVDDFQKMMQESLKRQEIGISATALRLLQDQLRADAEKPAPATNTQINTVETGSGINQNSVERQSIEHTSKLEADYYRLESMTDESARDAEFRSLAAAMEERARITGQYSTSRYVSESVQEIEQEEWVRRM